MGYCASGEGEIVLRKLNEKEMEALYCEFLKKNNRFKKATFPAIFKNVMMSGDPLSVILGEINDTYGEFDGVYSGDTLVFCGSINAWDNITALDAVRISISHNDKYDEDEITELLDILEPYTQSGNITFTGEDDCYWQFDFRDGEWHEDNGTIVYETDAPIEVRARTEGKTTVITISKGGYEIRLTTDEFQRMVDEANHEVFYRQDVVNYLETLVENNYLDEKVLDDEATISEFVNLYADNRSKHDPGKGSFVWDYSQSLENAFHRCESINKYKKEN